MVIVRLLIFFLLSAIHISVDATPLDDFNRHFRLTPTPQQVQILPGKGIAFHQVTAIHLEGINTLPAIGNPIESLLISDKAGKGIITLRLSEDKALPVHNEGYLLEVINEQIIISARSVAGLFYGCQTLAQLLEDSRDQNVPIPGCRITDFPNNDYRGVLIVLAHHLSVGNYYYRIIDQLARIKVNAIILQFEDKLRFRKAPIVGAANAISIEEFAAICRYANERFIEVSPLVQGLGHAGYILKHDEYRRLREHPESDLDFSPLDSGTYKVLFALYEDAMEATPGGKYLHVGGDEVENLGTSELSKKSGMNPFQLQMYWLNRVCQFAKAHDRIPIFWDDMLFKLVGKNLFGTMMHDIAVSTSEIEREWKENEPKLDDYISLFPKNCIYMRWNYRHAEILGNQKAIDWFKSHHLKVMGATAATSHPEVLFPRNNSNVEAIKTYCQIAGKKKMDGILCTIWDDRSPHFETIWRGIYGFALFSWNVSEQPLEHSNAIFRHRFYSPELANAPLDIQNELEQALVFWETGLVKTAKRSRYPRVIDLIDLPDPSSPGEWGKRYDSLITKARHEIIRYERIKKTIDTYYKQARRNRYNVRILNEVNEMQIYPAKLLLLLGEYDKLAVSPQKKSLKDKIERFVTTGFDKMRKELESVYSETRFMKNPDGYVLDQIPHLANGTNNSDWMFVFELAMNTKIREWLNRI